MQALGPELARGLLTASLVFLGQSRHYCSPTVSCESFRAKSALWGAGAVTVGTAVAPLLAEARGHCGA
eukprot:6129877-Amphidinium_carterae.1